MHWIQYAYCPSGLNINFFLANFYSVIDILLCWRLVFGKKCIPEVVLTRFEHKVGGEGVDDLALVVDLSANVFVTNGLSGLSIQGQLFF